MPYPRNQDAWAWGILPESIHSQMGRPIRGEWTVHDSRLSDADNAYGGHSGELT